MKTLKIKKEILNNSPFFNILLHHDNKGEKENLHPVLRYFAGLNRRKNTQIHVLSIRIRSLSKLNPECL